MVMVEPAIQPFDEHELAAHGRFLRGLAGSLVADPASADDAVQEAWLAALRRRPDPDRPLRPWLARVVVNAVKKLGRGRARVASRERAAARPEALPDAGVRREREARLRGLLDAVLALPESEREAVLLRYYESLPARAIAARLGLPVEQVYARLKRALALLRRRLDADHGGRRGPWVLGLAGALGLPRELLPLSLPAGTAGAAAGGAGASAGGAGALPTLTGALIMSSTTVTAAVVSLVVGAGVGWFVGSRGASEANPPAERAPADPGRMGTLPPPVAPGGSGPSLAGQDPAQQVSALRERLASLQQTLAEREKQLAEAKEQLAALAPAPFDPKALRFGITGATPVFDKADWGTLSGHMVEMTRAMPRFRAKLEEGGGLPQDLLQELQEHNTPLAIFAVGASSELKGAGPNGAYTHPAVIANLMRAALLAANDPLTPGQEAGIVALGGSWAVEDERLRRALAADAPALASTVAEVDAKQRFLDGVKGLLTPSQRGVLFRPETENRLQLDLLSPVLVYIAGIVPAEETDPAKLGAKALSTLLATTGLKDVDAAALAGIGERWLDELPRGRDAHPPADPDLRFPTVETVQAWARAQVAAVQRILESGRVTPEQATRLRKARAVVAPYVVKAP